MSVCMVLCDALLNGWLRKSTSRICIILCRKEIYTKCASVLGYHRKFYCFDVKKKLNKLFFKLNRVSRLNRVSVLNRVSGLNRV